MTKIPENKKDSGEVPNIEQDYPEEIEWTPEEEEEFLRIFGDNGTGLE